MASTFGGTGRPTNAQRDMQRKAFVRLVLAGAKIETAVTESGIRPDRIAAILDELAAVRVVTLDPTERLAA